MFVRQIGNGSAFNTKMTNSSFLIKKLDRLLLFDCGYNVFTKLREMNENINDDFKLSELTDIYISHLDDGHIGSIKSLIYYQYFMNNVKLTILYPIGLANQIKSYLSDIDGKVENGERVICDLFKLRPIKDHLYMGKLHLNLTDTHHYKTCKGLYIVDRELNTDLYISGDTKATIDINNNYLTTEIGKKPITRIYHDFSNFDNESVQVHACKTDVERIYGGVFNNVIKYHNDEEFNEDWVNLE